MQFADLHVFPEGHPPSPYDRPAMIFKAGQIADGFLPKGLSLCTVGWLEKPGFATGPVSEACIEALFVAHADRIIADGTRGWHICTLCGIDHPSINWRGQVLNLYGQGHYLVQMDTIVFMAPELMLHYVLEHQYCPPHEFVQATIHGRFLANDDLVIRWRNG